MAFQEDTTMLSSNDPLAAALAAAAALAQNGGSFLYEAPTAVPVHSPKCDSPSPSSEAPSSPSPSFIYSNSSDCDKDDVSNSNDDSKGADLDDDTVVTNEEDAKKRMARSRERNREHARRTRRRKKAQLEALQSKARSLHAENKNLQQSLEECRIASILVGFSVSDGDDRDATIQTLLKEATEIEGKEIFKKMTEGKRSRFVSDASDIAMAGASPTPPGNSFSLPLKIVINGKMTVIGGDGRSHLNWKTGMYTDEKGNRTLFTNKQLEALRRERNRMHAKMTRDRKKSFIADIEKIISELESSNKRMTAVLAEVIQCPKSPSFTPPLVSPKNTVTKSESCNLPGVTPSCSPALAPRNVSCVSVPELIPALLAPSETKMAIHTAIAPLEGKYDDEDQLPPKKRVCHGFTLLH